MNTTPQLHLHPDAIQHNMSLLRDHLQPYVPCQSGPRLWAVVKANAYGHGLKGMLPGLQHADGLAISSTDDAYVCRAAGWSGPLLHLAWHKDHTILNDPVLAPLHIVVSHLDQVALLEQGSASFKTLHVWLRFAGALNHSGLKPKGYVQAYQRLARLRQQGRLVTLGHLQHYAHAEDSRTLNNERQLFCQLIHNLPGPVCSENSAAMLSSPRFSAGTTWIRSGLFLYGASPLGPSHPSQVALRPAMTLRAPIYAVQNLEAGESLGYGSTFQARHAMRVGLVRCGYADGYPRLATRNCPCSIGGRPARLIGRVTMDTLSIDITAYPDVSTGDVVSLWGEYGVSANQVADASNTIAAQLFTAITAHVPRHYPGDRDYVASQA